jgi:type I restriction enzyme S subunit
MNKYQSYKPSGIDWIGEIPKEWSTKRLTYSFKIQKGKIPSELLDEPIIDCLPYLSMDVLRGNEPTEFSIDKKIVEVKDGDIGILWDGSNSGEIIKINRNGILSSTVSLLTIIDRGLNKEFGYYLLKLFENDFKSNTTGMGIPHVNGNYVRETKLILPPLKEQVQIVQFLDEKTELIDKLISTKERKLTLLKEQRTSLINQVVTKGLFPDVKMKDSGVEWIGEIPESWVKSRLDFLCDLKGRVGWKSLKSDEYVDEGYKFLSTPNIKNKEIDYENVNYITEERYLESPEIMLKNGDVLLVKDGSTLGIVNIVKNLPSPTTVNSSIGVLKNRSNKLIPEFLFYFLSSHYCQNIIDRMKGGMGVPHLFQSDIKKFEIFLPNILEQNQIVEFLDSKTIEIDDLMDLEQHKIELLKEYRQSLISEVVTGKIKVTTDE